MKEITVSAHSVERMRQIITDFDQLSEVKRRLPQGGTQEDWNRLHVMQLSVAHMLVGLCDGILKANDV